MNNKKIPNSLLRKEDGILTATLAPKRAPKRPVIINGMQNLVSIYPPLKWVMKATRAAGIKQSKFRP